MKPEGLEHVKGAIRTIEAEAQRKKYHGEAVVAAGVEKDVEVGPSPLSSSMQFLQQKEIWKMHNHNKEQRSSKAMRQPAQGKNLRRSSGMKQPTQRALNHTKMPSVARSAM